MEHLLGESYFAINWFKESRPPPVTQTLLQQGGSWVRAELGVLERTPFSEEWEEVITQASFVHRLCLPFTNM